MQGLLFRPLLRSVRDRPMETESVNVASAGLASGLFISHWISGHRAGLHLGHARWDPPPTPPPLPIPLPHPCHAISPMRRSSR